MNKSLHSFEGPVRALFTDLDGTMVTEGRLTPATYSALGSLFDVGLPVVLVTGRPAGWGHALASLLPFTAVIAENGGVSFLPDADGLRKVFAMPESELSHWREVMRVATADVLKTFDGAALSGDSAYREFDLAIDWNEEATLEAETADRIVAFLHARGLAASRSSVHVNFGPPGVDKWGACEHVLQTCFSNLTPPYDDVVYVGDSLNDAPVFAGLANSVGVANVRERWDELPHKPRYVTASEEGVGFGELVSRIRAILSSPA